MTPNNQEYKNLSDEDKKLLLKWAANDESSEYMRGYQAALSDLRRANLYERAKMLGGEK